MQATGCIQTPWKGYSSCFLPGEDNFFSPLALYFQRGAKTRAVYVAGHFKLLSSLQGKAGEKGEKLVFTKGSNMTWSWNVMQEKLYQS